jgi:protein-S-isoprenylcysteine O-methyltransferase Ste14
MAFESIPVAVIALTALAIIVVRTALEDAMLRRELAGYAAYTRQVRYRLIPFIW